jgi:hypothetical protein
MASVEALVFDEEALVTYLSVARRFEIPVVQAKR